MAGWDSDRWRLVTFWLIGEYRTILSIMKNFATAKFSRPIRLLDFLQSISPERLYLLNSCFVWQFSIMIETCRIYFGHWWLLEFFLKCPLKSSYVFQNWKHNSSKLFHQYSDMSDRNLNPKVIIFKLASKLQILKCKVSWQA